MANAPAEEILDVLIVGAGFAGICAGKVLHDMGITTFKIYDKAPAIGGTWYHNTYPGAACDVASHFYCYSFEPNPNWSYIYSPQKEILAYIQHCAKKYNVDPHVELNKKIDKFVWDEAAGLWTAYFSDATTQKARQIINGMGGLHVPHYPDIPGYTDFEGPYMHSARWDHDVDFTGKTVSIIGSAASAVQIIPELAKTCSQITVFQRTPNYVVARNNRRYSPREQRRMARWPVLTKWKRFKIYLHAEFLAYRLMVQDKLLGKIVTRLVKKKIKDDVKNPDKIKHMIPDYTIGCKRILLSDKFYKALGEDHVNLVTDRVERITSKGVETVDGTVHGSDILVLATGYDIDAHFGSIEVVGKGGVTLSSLGRDGQEVYKGTAHPLFPNYFWVTGPNTGVGSTSVVHMIELQMQYISKLITEGLKGKSIAPKKAALRAHNDALQEALSRFVWASGCNSWYKRDDGKIVTLYPGSARDFAREHKDVVWDDFDIVDITA